MGPEVFRSNPADCGPHPYSHWVDLGNGWECTSLPIYDHREELCAALGRGPAEKWCRANGLELCEADDMRLLHARSHYVPPVTLPTEAMLLRDRVPRPWVGSDGRDTPAMARYRAAHMMGREWAALHDYLVWLALAQSGWNGVDPVANFGKQWVGGASRIFGWRRPDGSFIQPEANAHAGEPEFDDYGTTFFAKRRKRLATTTTTEHKPNMDPFLTLGDADPKDTPDGPVRKLQRLLLGAGYVLPKYGADGGMGDETISALERAQKALGLEVTRVANEATWSALRAAQGPEWLAGVDISSNQQLGWFDWPALAAEQGWLIARATYGVKPDKIFLAAVAAARKAGMTVGAYHFFRQHQDPTAQLAAFRAQLSAADFGKGDIVPTIDLEDNVQFDGALDPAAHNRAGRSLVEQCAELFGRAMIYTAPYHWQNLGRPAWMLEGHAVWIADPTHWQKSRGAPRWPDGWAIWQIGAEHRTGYADGQRPKNKNHVIDVNYARALPLI